MMLRQIYKLYEGLHVALQQQNSNLFPAHIFHCGQSHFLNSQLQRG